MPGRQAYSEPPDPRLLRRRGSGSFQVPGSGPMPRRCPECKLAGSRQRPSVPRPREDDSGGGWLRVQLEQPGVLLLRRLCPRRAEGSGGRHVRTHWCGYAHLPMTGCTCFRPLRPSRGNRWQAIAVLLPAGRPLYEITGSCVYGCKERTKAGVPIALAIQGRLLRPIASVR